MKIYLNAPQLKFIQARQRIKTSVWGRGSGKSTLIGVRTRQTLKDLPRGKIFFSSSTYAQILTKTMPAIEAMWQRFGLKEYISADDKGHYVVGKKPPKEFAQPYSPPRKFQNVITFFNGFTIEFLSMDRPDLARGGSYDGGDIDEAALVHREHFTKVLLPSVRGNTQYFTSALHQQVCLYTSMPWKTSGSWILDYEDKALSDPETYLYLEATALDNLRILGQDYIEILRKEMTPLEFAVEVMNERMNRIDGQFYTEFNDQVHCYTPAYNYSEGERGITIDGPRQDYNPEQIIEVSMDFSGWFNGMLCIQPHQKEDRVFDLLFAKDDKKINHMIDEFCERYAAHRMKYVRVWGEPRGHDRQPNSDTLYDQIKARYNQNGWACEIKSKPIRTTAHAARHYFMNELLSERNTRIPRLRINQEKCKELIIAIQMTAVRPDFTKDKSKEKDRNFPQEHAPHFTDMLDYYFYEKYSGRSRAGGGMMTKGATFG